MHYHIAPNGHYKGSWNNAVKYYRRIMRHPDHINFVTALREPRSHLLRYAASQKSCSIPPGIQVLRTRNGIHVCRPFTSGRGLWCMCVGGASTNRVYFPYFSASEGEEELSIRIFRSVSLRGSQSVRTCRVISCSVCGAPIQAMFHVMAMVFHQPPFVSPRMNLPTQDQLPSETNLPLSCETSGLSRKEERTSRCLYALWTTLSPPRRCRMVRYHPRSWSAVCLFVLQVSEELIYTF